jgi:hypothetical protein
VIGIIKEGGISNLHIFFLFRRYVGLASLYNQLGGTPWAQVAATLFINLHSFWNGPFFMRQTVEALVLECVNTHELAGSREKGKQVRLGDVQKLCAKGEAGAKTA